MNKFYLLALYFIGFFFFSIFMEILNVGDNIESTIHQIYSIDKTNSNKGEDIDIGINFLNTQKNSDEHEKRTVLQPEDSKKPLKLSKEELGRHSWALLHSIAASMPSLPTNEQRETLSNFINTFAEVYPCKICSAHFKEMLRDYPVRNASREEFVLYLCELHNKVNHRLGKPIHDCKTAFEIWGGDCGCNVEPEEEA